MITRHFLACISRDASGDETVVSAVMSNEEFTATGLYIHQRNYLEVYIYDRWNAKEIHPYETGQTFQPTTFTMVDGKTSAPNLLTESELIGMMDKHGIGTDATHAEHINTVMERGMLLVLFQTFYIFAGVTCISAERQIRFCHNAEKYIYRILRYCTFSVMQFYFDILQNSAL